MWKMESPKCCRHFFGDYQPRPKQDEHYYGFNCTAGGWKPAWQVCAWKERHVERRGTFEDVTLFVQGHAITSMWVYQQQSEHRSRGVWVGHMYCKRARNWANKGTQASENRSVHSKPRIYVCSKPWTLQGQNNYMKSMGCIFCLYIYMHSKGVTA